MVWAIYALLSAVFISARDITAKKLFVNKEIEHKNILFHEYITYLIVLLFLIPTIAFPSFFDYWYLYLFKASTVGIAGYIYFKLLRDHDITMVAPLLNLSPLILLIFTALILNESVTTLQLIGILIMVVATYYLEVVLQHHHHDKPHKHHWYQYQRKGLSFLLTIVFLLTIISLAAIADRLVLEQVNVPTNLFFTSILIVITLIFMYKPKTLKESIVQYKTHPKTILYGALNVCSTALILLAISIPAAIVSVVIPLRRTATLFSSIFGGLLFHEKKLPQKIAAVALMLVGVILLV